MISLKKSSRILNLILLTAYLSFAFRITIPIMHYAINFSYIVQELCEQKDSIENYCLGQCHLSKEIKKQVEMPTKNYPQIVIEFLKIPHLSNERTTLLKCSYSKTNNNLIIEEKELSLLLEPKIPPPKSA